MNPPRTGIVDLGHTRLDTDREQRCGHPEVVFGAGKTPDQIVDVSRAILEHHDRLFVTRVSPEASERLQAEFPRIAGIDTLPYTRKHPCRG